MENNRVSNLEQFPALKALKQNTHVYWNVGMTLYCVLLLVGGQLVQKSFHMGHNRLIGFLLLKPDTAVFAVLFLCNTVLGCIVIWRAKKRPTMFWGILSIWEPVVEDWVVRYGKSVELRVLVAKAHHVSGNVLYAYNPATKAHLSVNNIAGNKLAPTDALREALLINCIRSVSLVLEDVDTGELYSLSHHGTGFCAEFVAHLESQDTILAWALMGRLTIDRRYLADRGLTRTAYAG